VVEIAANLDLRIKVRAVISARGMVR